MFQRLTEDELRTITRMLLEKTVQRLREKDIEVQFSPEAVNWVAERGYQPEFGARPLRRAIERHVDDRISDLLLDGRLEAGSRLKVGVRDGDLDFQVVDRIAV